MKIAPFRKRHRFALPDHAGPTLPAGVWGRIARCPSMRETRVFQAPRPPARESPAFRPGLRDERACPPAQKTLRSQPGLREEVRTARPCGRRGIFVGPAPSHAGMPYLFIAEIAPGRASAQKPLRFQPGHSSGIVHVAHLRGRRVLFSPRARPCKKAGASLLGLPASAEKSALLRRCVPPAEKAVPLPSAPSLPMKNRRRSGGARRSACAARRGWCTPSPPPAPQSRRRRSAPRAFPPERENTRWG